MRKVCLAVLFPALCLLASCNGGRNGAVAGAGDTLRLRFARLLTIVKHPHCSLVTLADPWHEGKTLHTYVLVSRQDSASAGLLPEGTVVYTPVRRSVVFTTVHCGLLYDLHAEDAISGVCDLKYIQIPDLQRRAAEGSVADCGSSMGADIERLVAVRPQAVVVSPYENYGGYDKLRDMGIPIVEAADYMEATPLGRAEWMVFYGMLYGREEEARKLFADVSRNYQELCGKARKTRRRPTVITERRTGGVWYVPGGRSFMARFIHDAGGRYAFSADRSMGSLSLSFEQVLDGAGQSDVWLYKYGDHPGTLAELRAEYAGYTAMKAFRTGRVYGADTNRNHYFEEASFHPDRVLSDMVAIFHPELKQGPLRYYHPLRAQ